MAVPTTVHVFTKSSGLLSALRRKLPDVNFVEIACKLPTEAMKLSSLSGDQLKLLQDAEILVGEPAVLCDGVIHKLPKLKWLQSTWAGCDSILQMLDPSKPKPTFQLTRAASVYNRHIAEWAVGHIIAWERNFTLIKDNQRQSLWQRESVIDVRLLREMSIGIIGCGSIGLEIARAFKAFDMTVWGLTRTEVDKSSQSPNVDRYVLQDSLPELLSSCDYVCNVLPSTLQTKDLLSGDTLKAAAEKKPVLLNAGRGDIISDESLLHALKQNWISGAILDVFNEEPLPSTSPLWTTPNVVITPHVAGTGHQSVVADVFAVNFERYQKGEPLKYAMSWEQGY